MYDDKNNYNGEIEEQDAMLSEQKKTEDEVLIEVFDMDEGERKTEEEVIPYVAPCGHEYKPEFEVLEKNSEKRKKGGERLKRGLITALAAIIFGCFSLGFGLAMGFNLSDRIVSGITPLKFRFDDGTGVSGEEIRATFMSASTDVSGMIKSVQDSVVNISMISKISENRIFFNQIYEAEGSGSGVIFNEDDNKVYIVTNSHVVSGASTVNVTVGEATVPAKLVGKSQDSDIAVISIDKKDLESAGVNSVKTAVFANSDEIEVGEQVIAIGNALGQGKTVTSGIISVKQKTITVENNTLDVIQTDAAINPGNSGGALVNRKGEVIGISTAKFASMEVEGTGFAIPSNIVQSAIDSLMAGGDTERPYLGVTGFAITQEFKDTYNIDIDGFYVKSVSPSSTARAAGIVASDIIVGLNGVKTPTYDDLTRELLKCRIGDKVSINIVRNGVEEMTLYAEIVPLSQEF